MQATHARQRCCRARRRRRAADNAGAEHHPCACGPRLRWRPFPALAMTRRSPRCRRWRSLRRSQWFRALAMTATLATVPCAGDPFPATPGAVARRTRISEVRIAVWRCWMFDVLHDMRRDTTSLHPVRSHVYLQAMLLNELTDGAEIDQVLLVRESERRQRATVATTYGCSYPTVRARLPAWSGRSSRRSRSSLTPARR